MMFASPLSRLSPLCPTRSIITAVLSSKKRKSEHVFWAAQVVSFQINYIW